MRRYTFGVAFDIPRTALDRSKFRLLVTSAAHNLLGKTQLVKPQLGFTWHTRRPETDPLHAFREIRAALMAADVLLMSPQIGESWLVELEEKQKPWLEVTLSTRLTALTDSKSARSLTHQGADSTTSIATSASAPKLITYMKQAR